ncbi:hypothetical protein DM02DRAFT_617454 [Periconia macrospinosa]|uniref:Uncharacterized protein n=1 Tax=Periconia macrospinosa TaxID=97972 RepID=A0A2V1DEM2_9PLEO|nr:hypothetical protein DM02DRAFT_617454 [Periconia macrospinosa]
MHLASTAHASRGRVLSSPSTPFTAHDPAGTTTSHLTTSAYTLLRLENHHQQPHEEILFRVDPRHHHHPPSLPPSLSPSTTALESWAVTDTAEPHSIQSSKRRNPLVSENVKGKPSYTSSSSSSSSSTTTPPSRFVNSAIQCRAWINPHIMLSTASPN